MHYLNRTQGKALPGYLQAVAARKPGELLSPAEELKLFQEHFGPVNEAFVNRFSSFILNLTYKPGSGF